MAKRERKTDDFLILKFHKEGRSQRWIARELGCSKTAVLKRLRKLLSDGGHHAENQKETNEIPKPKYSESSRYLRKIGTNEIYAWASGIAGRLDMEEVRWTGKKFVLVTKVQMQAINDLGRS